MLHIAHAGRLGDEERQMLETLAAPYGLARLDEAEDHVPRFWYAGGAGVEVPLAFLVLSFLGTGAAIVLKSFLEGIGSEAAKKVIEYFSRKASSSSSRPSAPAYPIVLVYEPRSGVIAAMLMSPSAVAAIAKGALPFSTLETALNSVPAGAAGVITCYYSDADSSWRAFGDRVPIAKPMLWDPVRGVFEVVQ